MNATAQYRFGDFKLLPGERLLFRRGIEQAMTARAFALLVTLVERAGQLVAKDDLMQRVWAGVIVEDNNLAVQVGVLRKLLGAEAIATVPGFGYRFALEVIDVGGCADLPAREAPIGRGNLPLRLPALIGREAELAEAATLLHKHPLLTICGGPGFGKTRLAQELALRQRGQDRDGAWWVDLTLLRSDESPAQAVARTLGLALGDGDDTLIALTSRLASTAIIIVLDNAEHRADEVAGLAAALVRDTAHVRLVVTSQVPLRVVGEYLFRLPPLPADDALQLLAARAGSEAWVGDEREKATAICEALDFNALAIELAAVRIDALGLQGLASRLNQRLTLLAPGDTSRASRRNALAAAMEWAHDLLGARERRVLRRLGVFPGSFSIEGAALVLADAELPAARVVETLLVLVERSLVAVERGTHRRFRLLETTRLFALAQLDATGETDTAQAQFCAGMRWLFDDAYQESWRMPARDWLGHYRPELTALWAALRWAGEHDLESAAALFGASAPLWRQLGGEHEARAHALLLADRMTPDIDATLRARFWLACAHCHTQFHPGPARAAAERAVAIFHELGDARGEYVALVEYAFNWRVDGPEARGALQRAKALESPGWPAAVIERGRTAEAVLHMSANHHDLARRCYVDALEVCRRSGFERGEQRAMLNLADLERAAGHIEEAVELGQALSRSLHDDDSPASLFTTLTNLIGALLAIGRHDAARDVAGECSRRVGRLPIQEYGWVALDAMALLHLHDGDPATAARLAGASDRELELHGQPQRQPNEAADRAALDAGLTRALAAEQISLLQAEGRRMRTSESVALAFGLGPAAETPRN